MFPYLGELPHSLFHFLLFHNYFSLCMYVFMYLCCVCVCIVFKLYDSLSVVCLDLQIQFSNVIPVHCVTV